MQFQFRKLGQKFEYRKAMAQQERGGQSWAVVTNVTKMPDGRVAKTVYQSALPSRHRAKTLARVLNLAL